MCVSDNSKENGENSEMNFQVSKVEMLPDPNYVKLYLNLYASTIVITTKHWVEMGQPNNGDGIKIEIMRIVK